MSIRAFGVAAAIAVAGAAQAQVGPAVINFTGGSQFGTFEANGDTIGWTFRANSNIQVTSLGYWDSTPATPLGLEKPVGIWNAQGVLLASTTVAVNDALSGPVVSGGQYRYRGITPLNLVSGQQYYIGAFVAANNTDVYVSSNTTLTTATEVTHLGATVDPAGVSAGLAFPSVVAATNRGRHGPNFTFIPSPGALAVLGLGALAAARRRR